MTREEIALVIKNARMKAGFTQAQAAQAIGRKRQTLASWETAQSQPDADTLFTLFDVYGQSIDEAFGFRKKKLSLNKMQEYNQDQKKLIGNFNLLDRATQASVQQIIAKLAGARE